MPYPAYNYPNFQQQYPQVQQMQNYFTPNMQQQIQQNQFPIINNLGGKIVDTIEAVRVTDIPIDGNNYYFPKADGSEIYVKKWLGNGTTEVSTFKRTENVTEEENKIDFNAMENNIIEKLNLIDERLGKLEKGLTSKSTNARKE